MSPLTLRVTHDRLEKTKDALAKSKSTVDAYAVQLVSLGAGIDLTSGEVTGVEAVQTKISTLERDVAQHKAVWEGLLVSKEEALAR